MSKSDVRLAFVATSRSSPADLMKICGEPSADSHSLRGPGPLWGGLRPPLELEAPPAVACDFLSIEHDDALALRAPCALQEPLELRLRDFGDVLLDDRLDLHLVRGQDGGRGDHQGG